ERVELLAIERSSGVNGRVLIVEDDAELAEHYCLVLSAAGIEAKSLTDPRRLMAELYSFQPDIVLMDIRMPGIGGLEATRRILRIDDSIRVIVVTACADDPYPTRVMQSG
ncbi:response regulator, partial [Pantoea sp. SIMBA_133]